MWGDVGVGKNQVCGIIIIDGKARIVILQTRAEGRLHLYPLFHTAALRHFFVGDFLMVVACDVIIPPRDLNVLPCRIGVIRNFIETYHYSHSINGVKISYCFAVYWGKELVGGIVFGQMATTAWKKFSDAEDKVLELRRLVLLDNAGKNSESRVIGRCLQWLRRNILEVEVIVSYADPYHGHCGIIYKASNFEYLGLSGKDFGFYDPETKRTYHSRALRTKYKGEYKPFVKRLREKLGMGRLKKVELPGKHCFVYRLRKEKKAESLKVG